MSFSVDRTIALAKGYRELPRISDCYVYHDVNYDFFQHDNGDVYYLCGWADSAKDMAVDRGRVWAVLPDEDILKLAFMRIPPEDLFEYVSRKFKDLYLNFPR